MAPFRARSLGQHFVPIRDATHDIITEDAVMNADTLPQVEMPAKDRFVMDNRRGGRELRD